VSKIYECIGKGGRYRVLSMTVGAGTCKGQHLIVYQCIDDGECYHRTLDDFKERMSIVKEQEK
jgi:hypothetical protein